MALAWLGAIPALMNGAIPGDIAAGYIQRLQALIAERLEPGADKAAVDARIWDTFGETWAVLLPPFSQ